MMNKLKYLFIYLLIWIDNKVVVHGIRRLCEYVSFHPWLDLAPYKRIDCMRCGQIPILDYNKLMAMPWLQFLTEVLRDAPEKATYRQVARWLTGRFSQQQLMGMYAKLYTQLAELVFTDPYQENQYYAQEDFLRDQMDVFWYAIEDRGALEGIMIPIWEERQSKFLQMKQLERAKELQREWNNDIL